MSQKRYNKMMIANFTVLYMFTNKERIEQYLRGVLRIIEGGIYLWEL